MENELEIIKILATQGPFAVLFVALLFWVLRENAKREAAYQETIDKLADKFAIVEDIKEDIGEIKAELRGRGVIK